VQRRQQVLPLLQLPLCANGERRQLEMPPSWILFRCFLCIVFSEYELGCSVSVPALKTASGSYGSRARLRHHIMLAPRSGPPSIPAYAPNALGGDSMPSSDHVHYALRHRVTWHESLPVLHVWRSADKMDGAQFHGTDLQLHHELGECGHYMTALAPVSWLSGLMTTGPNRSGCNNDKRQPKPASHHVCTMDT
jgi:hypothetical protein